MSAVLYFVAFILSVQVVTFADRQWASSSPDEYYRGNLTHAPVKAGFCDHTKQYSGYYKIDGSKSKNYFFWFFESRHDPKNDPLVIWLTGGPGCSSILALFVENGPCVIQDDMTLDNNPYSWNTRANIMWIDQPAGVGFSYGDESEYDSTEKEVGDDMYHFLQEFLTAHPEYQRQGFHVFGESYGGHYVPAVASRIFQGNQNLSPTDLHINLAGIGIGNGLTNPEVQYQYYPKMAYENTYGVHAVSASTYEKMTAAIPICTSMIKLCQTKKPACFVAEMFCNAALVAPYQLSGLNVYDIREKCKVFPMCYDFSHVEQFLNLESTRSKLHVTAASGKWTSCNMKVHAKFNYDWMKSFNQLVTPMVEAGVKVLVYAGDADFIVNWMGCKAWTLALDWKHREEFQSAKDLDWTNDVTGKVIGKIRSVAGLTFVQVFEAGHMVPMNQPQNALQLLDDFIAMNITTTTQAPVQTEEASAQESDLWKQTVELAQVM